VLDVIELKTARPRAAAGHDLDAQREKLVRLFRSIEPPVQKDIVA
jgi:hypothetical protein